MAQEDENFDDDGNMITPNYELSENQQQFVDDAEEAGYTVDYGYSGRGMFGRECPSIIVEGIADFATKADYKADNMGMDYVIYAQD
jgi:hypothetical protein